MSELGQQLFLKSRDQYETAIRWAFLLILFGVVLHATVLSSAVELHEELYAKRRAVETLTAMRSAAGELSRETAAFQEALARQRTRADSLTTDWMGSLKVQLAQLGDMLQPDFQGIAVESAPMMVQQLAPSSGRSETDGPGPTEVRNALVRMIQSSNLPEALPAEPSAAARQKMVVQFVNEQIIPPSFARLNAAWEVPEKLEDRASHVKGAIGAMETAIDSTILRRALRPDQWSRLLTQLDHLGAWRQTVDTAIAAVDTMEFRPPPERMWWGTVQGKADQQVAMASNAKQAVRGVDIADRRLKALIEEMEQAARQQEQATEDIGQRLAELEEQLNAGAAGVGIGWLPLGNDMNTIVGRFPLLLGLLLAAVTAWVTYRRTALIRAANLLSSGDIDEQDRRFLELEYSQSPAPANWIYAGLVVAGIGWIGLAAATALGSPLVDSGSVIASAIGGVLVFSAAAGYRLDVIRQGPLTAESLKSSFWADSDDRS